jgi:hypothetical protein
MQEKGEKNGKKSRKKQGAKNMGVINIINNH